MMKSSCPKPLEIDNSNNRKKMKSKKKAHEDVATMASSSSLSSTQKSRRLPYKRRNPKVLFAPVRRGGRFGDSDVEAAALPLGMSFAAIVAQVLERKEAADKTMSVDHLSKMIEIIREVKFKGVTKKAASPPSKICASAVRESLANVFGNKFDFFAKNFEKSFESTLRTLRLINEASVEKEPYCRSHLNAEDSASDLNAYNGIDCVSSFGIKDCHSESETESPSIMVQNQMHADEEVEDSLPHLNRELALHGRINQPLGYAQSISASVANQLSTIEKSVMEQARSNDLKTLEISLAMKKLKLKETQLALNFDANHLERSKLAMGVSKASFKVEKFKNQLEDTRHGELLRKCIDCLVAGLFIMSASIIYGAYVFSYQRITDATASCSFLEESKSWWMPRSVSSVNSGWHSLKCHVQVVSRMLFGIIIILAIAYLLLQRTAASRQTMPITFILLLLGAACGFAGKFCVDTLGGSGLLWLMYWETFLFVHFLSNVCTSTLFLLLHGPLSVSQGKKSYTICPYWVRRVLFYAVVLLFLPLCCGLFPFARPGEWKDHFFQLAADFSPDELTEEFS